MGSLWCWRTYHLCCIWWHLRPIVTEHDCSTCTGIGMRPRRSRHSYVAPCSPYGSSWSHKQHHSHPWHRRISDCDRGIKGSQCKHLHPYWNQGKSSTISIEKIKSYVSYRDVLSFRWSTRCFWGRTPRYTTFCLRQVISQILSDIGSTQQNKRQADAKSLPPCCDSLRLHMVRAPCDQAYVWRSLLVNQQELCSPTSFSWKEGEDGNLTVEWSTVLPAPEEILDLMFCTSSQAWIMFACWQRSVLYRFLQKEELWQFTWRWYHWRSRLCR